MSSANEEKDVELKKLVDELAILGRIVNAIAIEEKVKAGTLNRKDVIRELLNYKKTLTLESLTNANLMGLPDELKTLVSVVENQCKEKDGPCRGLGIVSKGIEAVESIGKLDVKLENLFEKGSPLDMLVSLKKASDAISLVENTCGTLTEYIKEVTSGTLPKPEMEDKLIYIRGYLETIVKSTNSIKFKYSSEQLSPLEASRINESITTILKLETFYTAFTNRKINIGLWSKTLKDLKNVLKALKISFSEDASKEMDAKMLILVDVNDDRSLPVQDKKETFGFHDGAKDLTKISVDLTSDFVINIVMNGTSVEELKNLFPYAIALEKELKPLMDIKSSMKSRNVARAVRNINGQLSSAKTQVNRFDSIQDFFDCYGDSIQDFVVDDWKPVQVKINNLPNVNEFKNFAQKLIRASFKIEKLANLLKLLGSTPNGSRSEAFGKFKEIGLVEKELSDLRTSLKGLIGNGQISTFFLTNSNLENLLSTASSILQNSQSASLSQCINNKKMLTNAKEVFNNLESLSDVVVLKSDNKDIADISEALDNVKALASEWGALEASTTTKPKRDAKTTPLLEDSSNVNEQFNKAISVLIDREDAFSVQPELKKLLENEKAIDNAVTTTNNAKAKNQLALVWTADTKETLKEVRDTASNKLQVKVPKPKNLSGYSKVFETKLDFKSKKDVDMALLIDNLIAINAPYPNQEDAAKLRNLHLNFANAQTLLAGGAVAFSSIVPFFNSLTLKNIPNSVTQKAPASVPATGWLSVGAIIGYVFCGCVFLIGIGIAIYFLIKWYRSRRERIRKEKLEKQRLEELERQRQEEEEEKQRLEELERLKKELALRPAVPKKQVVIAGHTAVILERTHKLDFKEDPWVPEVIENLTSPGVEEQKKEKAEKKPHVAIEMEMKVQKTDDELLDKLPKKEFAGLKEAHDIGADMKLIEDEIAKDAPVQEVFKFPQYPPRFFDHLRQVRFDNVLNKSDNEVKVHTSSKDWLVGNQTEIYTDEEVVDFEDLPTVEATQSSIFEASSKVTKKQSAILARTQQTQEDEVNRAPGGRDKKKLDYSYIASRMLHEDMLRVHSWPHTDPKDRNVYQFHMSHQDALDIIRDAGPLFEKEPVMLEINRKQTKVAGDIHGRYRDFAYQLVLTLNNDKESILFLGDYVDRGTRSIDIVLLMCVLKNINPNKFFFLAGNHETIGVNRIHGFYKECEKTFGEGGGNAIYMAANGLFRKMPACALLQEVIFCAHGGVSERMEQGLADFKNEIVKIPTNLDNLQSYLDLTWSDPVGAYNLDQDKPCFKFVPGRIQMVQNYTPMGLKYVLDKCGLKFCIRAHEVMKYGACPFAGKLGITVYSSTNNVGNNYGAQLTVYEDLNIHQTRFINTSDRPGPEKDEKTVKASRSRNPSPQTNRTRTPSP
ncbi:hypothetical protein CAEBREN_22839 [Caenorhabditis brenneri]|uniref:Serine/threonine-protein phosphatase n=1 Tax=Caenorhabditis brenneri TaxID=135651 RepID=G0NM21_CAEBE|nr:hypothetical protein CAEBREN_22839 [Caenorhabditis brenneri]